LDIYKIKLAALLHDIGKPASWSRMARWSEHIYDTHEAVKSVLGDVLALTAMRHHTGASYEEKYHPHSDEEWIVWLADKMSSGLDRREETQGFTWKPAPPFQLTHPLSKGEKKLYQYDAKETAKQNKELLEQLKSLVSENLAETYTGFYDALSKSFLKHLPADTRRPINDVSLWMHSKLTAAIATCIAIDGGWKGPDPKNYSFGLVSGDGDHISRFISESMRLPDLNARSRMVVDATASASNTISDLVGPDDRY